MNKERQIEEMERCEDCIHYAICIFHLKGDENKSCPHFENKAGYRKQREGEWIEDTEYYDDDYSECNVRKVFVCSKCGRTEKRKEPYCNCGAKMKGGADQ